ncbi:MAG TPA: coenzyme F420-0:L-glutamate ligase [Candidatus Methanoperedenaceae archaeon]|nr:coenzyme F420-0:L-glutamate ligase [Candidatus Methanoperedenaceae archaeon]
MKVHAYTVDGIPLIRQGDDLAGIICGRTHLQDGDIVVISSTVVSKAEGNLRPVKAISAGAEAQRIALGSGREPEFVQAVLDESEEVLLESPFLLVKRRNGYICVNAGIDRSNIEDGYLLLLPPHPDASARRLQDAIREKTGVDVRVMITDTSGRAFRIGQTGAAIGIAGIPATKDWRGTRDLFGRVLEVKNEAITDELAGFSNLLMGEGDGGTPVVVIRGLELGPANDNGIRELYRPESEDVILKALRETAKVRG